MKLRLGASLPPNIALALLSAATLLVLAATAASLSGRSDSRSPSAIASRTWAADRVLWHEGSFRYLIEERPGEEHDLVDLVRTLSHPIKGEYGMVSSNTRKPRFNELLDALFAAIEAGLADGNAGDWCRVKTEAAEAGYEVRRFYDTADGRWFVYGFDTTRFGQAYFFINPFAKRNIIVEVPHEPYDSDTAVQGARIFKDLAARALIINKEDRCSDPNWSTCSGETSACSADGSMEPYRESDVAHQPDNTFHLLHIRFNAMDSQTKFVQLHGFKGSSSVAVVGDGTKNDYHPGSVSVVFANKLQANGLQGVVHSCQGAPGNPTPAFCGETNIQGRYTNDPNADACNASTVKYSGRFLHIEQSATLRDDVQGSDGWYWDDVRKALRDTWPDCNMNNGAIDCTLGPQQTRYGQWTCP